MHETVVMLTLICTVGLTHDYDKAEETDAARRKGVRSRAAHRWKVPAKHIKNIVTRKFTILSIKI